MKHSEALQIIDNLIITIQKTRSNAVEALAADGDRAAMWALEECFPYTHGPKSILPIFLKISEQRICSPLDLFNMLTLIDLKGSDIYAMYVTLGYGVLPERQMSWLVDGWESEE